ncbi:MAG: 3-dehydroquinate synthase, partial [Rhizobacter sp.]|nr:3-dehydroquinate synthase [Chlorobiales bacterium]
MSRITIEPAALRHLGSQFENAHLDKRTVLFFDHNTERLFAETIESQLHEQGFELRKIVVPASERAKSLRVAEKVYGELIAAKVNRSWSIVAVGGGVVGDLAGFVAASFMRGLPLVNVPTTLLAMADSAIGGKVAVNHPRGKNLIGFFYEPVIVAIDPNFLNTLPPRDVRSGLAEILKYAFIGNENFLGYFETHLEKMLALQSPFIDQAIRTSVKAKINIVKRDPHETKGLRALLNFGHTFGHAIESAAGYGKLRHGEAVL